jgi:hypothetical protein
MMAYLLAEVRTKREEMKEAVRTNQAKADANLEKMKEDIRINQVKVDANPDKMKEEMMARLEAMIQANHEKIMVMLDGHHKRMEALMDACLGKTEATNLEANPEERVQVGASGSP